MAGFIAKLDLLDENERLNTERKNDYNDNIDNEIEINKKDKVNSDSEDENDINDNDNSHYNNIINNYNNGEIITNIHEKEINLSNWNLIMI